MKNSKYIFFGIFMITAMLFNSCAKKNDNLMQSDNSEVKSVSFLNSYEESSRGEDESTQSQTASSVSSSRTSVSSSQKPPVSSSKSSSSKQESSTSSQTTSKPPVNVPDDRLEKMGFGFYGLDIKNNPAAFSQLVKSDYCNTFFVGRSHHTMDSLMAGLREIDKYKKTAWLGISECIYMYYGTHTILDPNWKKNLSTVMDKIEEEGLMRSVRGLYFDEPFLCKIDRESFIMVTKYFRETYKDKGVFVCFSVTPIWPELWKPSYPVVELDREVGRYLTDVAYDYYADVRTADQHFDRLTSELKRRMGRDDVRIWYVPCTMSYHGNTDELFSIEHLNDLYQRLLTEENPGGIACYTYYTFPKEVEDLGNIGLDQLLQNDNPNRWDDLDYLLRSIGKEITQKYYK